MFMSVGNKLSLSNNYTRALITIVRICPEHVQTDKISFVVSLVKLFVRHIFVFILCVVPPLPPLCHPPTHPTPQLPVLCK